MERILNMILRRLVNKGVNSGIKAASNLGNKNRGQSPEERQASTPGKNGSRQLREATRMMRRLTRF